MRLYSVVPVALIYLFLLPETASASELLFEESPTPQDSRRLSQGRPRVIRTRRVTVDRDLLHSMRVKGDTAVLNLFDDTRVTFKLDAFQDVSGRYRSWSGSVEGQSWSVAILAEKDGVLVGTIKYAGELYRVRPSVNDTNVIDHIDESTFEREGKPVETSLRATPTILRSPLGPDPLIDVLVLYTPDALAEVGGVAAMEAIIALAERVTNTVYANSEIRQRVRIVHSEEVVYDESAHGKDTIEFYSQALALLRGTADGFMDNVHALRNCYGADLVALLVDSEGLCGQAYVQRVVSARFANLAFSVTKHDCAIENWSFAHELGHNMGAHHDWFVSDELDQPYSFNN